MAKSQVETVVRAAYLEDWRQTSTKTSLTTSSANVSSRTSRRTKRYRCTRCRANKLRMASLSPRAIRLTSVSSDSAWAAIDPEAGAAQPVDVKVAVMWISPPRPFPDWERLRRAKVPAPWSDFYPVRAENLNW